METQPLFPDCQLLILLSYLACGFLNTGPISLPVDLSSIATHYCGTKTSLTCTMLGTGDAVLFPAKGEFYQSEGDMLWPVASGKWISSICFPESYPGKNSGFE